MHTILLCMLLFFCSQQSDIVSGFPPIMLRFVLPVASCNGIFPAVFLRRKTYISVIAERKDASSVILYIQYISDLIIPHNPSVGPLSMQCPTRDIDCSMPCSRSLLLKYSARVLKSSVRMKNRPGIRIIFESLIVCVKHELIVISSAYDIRNWKSII